MDANARLRGVHQGMVQYAQNNKQAFPGGGADPSIYPDRNFATASERFRLLLDANLFVGEYIISPLEASKTNWTTGPVTTANFSYALLDIAPDGKRAKEWGNFRANSLAAMATDRSKAIDPTLSTTSVHVSATTNAAKDWRGCVAWNDNHVSFETDTVVKTRYDNLTTKQDDLFVEQSGDGLMRYD